MTKQLAACVLCIGAAWVGQPASAQQVPNPLPTPNDIPPPPPGTVSPGGLALPDMTPLETPSDAPAISAISETTFPNETLAITGENLTDATLILWHEGGLRSIKPLRAEHNKMLAVIPPDVPLSTCLVWPRRGKACGRPIRVNGPSAWWLWPTAMDLEDEPSELRIIGRNLSLAGIAPVVCITGPNGPLTLKPHSAEPYQLQVRIPTALPAGTYTLQTHNGSGGIHGWSERLTLQIRAATPSATAVFQPEQFGARPGDATDDTAAIQKAVDAAAKAGGGIVRFGPGDYAVSNPIDVAGNNIRLQGSGPGKYNAETDTVDGPHTCIRRLDKTDRSLPEAIIVIRGNRCEVRNLALKNNHNGNRQNVLRITGTDATAANVLLTMFDKRDWGNGQVGPPEEPAPERLPQPEAKNPQHDDEKGLLGAWDFEEEGGITAVDSSGRGNTGDLHGVRVEGPFGKAVRFPYRALARIPGERIAPSTALSLSAWFLSDSTNFDTNRTVIRKDRSFALRFADGRLGFLLWHDGRILAAWSPLLDWPNGVWHHLCATFDGKTMAVYLDGKPCGKRVLDEAVTVDNSPDDIHIGGLARMSLRGVLDRVRIHSRALPPADIQAEVAATAPRYASGEVTQSTYVGFPDPDKRVGLLNTGALQLYTRGSARALVQDCEIHCVGPGIEISPNIFTAERTRRENPEPMEPSTDDILVQRCNIRGYYGGEPDRLPSAGASGRTVGVVIHNGKRIIVEHCNFASANRYRRRILNRTMLSLNTANRWLYFAHNTSTDVGTHRSATGMDRNQGEQYLIHYRYTPGGLFHVLQSTPTETIIDTRNLSVHQDDPEYQSSTFLWNPMGSVVPPEVGHNRHWILFVSHGRGAGQLREITDRTDGDGQIRFGVLKPWRVTPDPTSRVHLIPAHRDMILYRNSVDGGRQILTDKTHGVTFWYWTFNTIVDGNTFRNMTAGVVYNCRYAGPCGWNLTRNNRIESMWGFTGDTSEKPALYVDHYRFHRAWAAPEDRVWYAVGNICRANEGADAQVAAFLHRRPDGNRTEHVSGPETDSGIVLGILENNAFTDTEEGIVISAPTNCCLIRNNRVETRNPNAPPVQDASPGKTDCIVVE